MAVTSVARIKAYILLQGLERSLASNVIDSFAALPRILNDSEAERAIRRLREDFDDTGWTRDDLVDTDLLEYLDIGDLLDILHRGAGPRNFRAAPEISSAIGLLRERNVISIRKRVMHPVRPLEPDDFPTLLDVAGRLPTEAPSLDWVPLNESLRLLAEPTTLVETRVLPRWTEQSSIVNNLPAPEFDDTGFIGRSNERRTLQTLLESDHRVITVVGDGGAGKTALALRVCNDLLDSTASPFQRIVWVSLKTQFLTVDGIRVIEDAIDTVGQLIRFISTPQPNTTSNDQWMAVIESMESIPTLLVIDNLETVGREARDLLVNVPATSKVLLTSRVGLGELELRYELPPFNPRDASRLYYSLATTYGYSMLQRQPDAKIREHCEQLGFNPLLIRWFVQAVGRGAMPDELLHGNEFDEALRYCYGNVYDSLSADSRRLVAALLAARQALTKAQLQDILGSDHVVFTQACQDLLRGSVVERVTDERADRFQISGLIYQYLATHHPPNDEMVSGVRDHLKAWQNEERRSFVETTAYRYNRRSMHVTNTDERIAAQYLSAALSAAKNDNLGLAMTMTGKAHELTPTWWMVPLVRAWVLEASDGQIFEIEEAFQRSIALEPNDVNRFHYATYLLRAKEFSRALEQVEAAAKWPDALASPLQGLRGWIPVQMERVDEGVSDLKEIWQNLDTSLPRRVRREQGTQLAMAYRRKAEQLRRLNDDEDAIECLGEALRVLDSIIDTSGPDGPVVGNCLQISLALTRIAEPAKLLQQEPFSWIGPKWDASASLRSWIVNDRRATTTFLQSFVLQMMYPTLQMY